VGHRCEIWSVAVLPRTTADGTVIPIVLTGASDELVRGYRLCAPSSSSSAAAASQQAPDASSEGSQCVLESYGALERMQTGPGSYDKCTGLEFNPAGNLLAVRSSGKVIEVRRAQNVYGSLDWS
jgi:hypothetical protein